MTKLSTILLLLATLTTSLTFAQRQEAGLFLGTSAYQGDLAKISSAFNELNFSVGLLHRYGITDKINLHSFVNYGKITGDETNFRTESNRTFSSNFIDLGTGIEYNFITSKEGDGINKLVPFVYLGIGITSMNPKTTGLPETAPELQEGHYSNLHLITPVGAGLRYFLSEKVSVAGQVIVKNAFSDYLDGISESGGDSNDWYIQAGLTVGYTFK